MTRLDMVGFGGAAAIGRCIRSLAVPWIAVVITPLACAVTYEMVPVGNPGNAADPSTGSIHGAVGYDYRIGKYEVTIGQYAEFLTAVAATDPYGLFTPAMAIDTAIAGIARSGSSGAYSYSVLAPAGITPVGASSPGNRPITYVSWYDAARFANWMSNGQGSGNTETGAYTISTGEIVAASRTGGVNTYTLAASSTLSVGDQVTVEGLSGSAFNLTGIVSGVSGAQFTIANPAADEVATGTGRMVGASATASPSAAYRIPTESEWYKSAFYSPQLNGGAGGYYSLATQSNAVPGNQIGSLPNQANYRATVDAGAVYAVTQSTTEVADQNYLTDVGAFTASASYYGTFDQSGNVWEWNAALYGSYGGPGSERGLRGSDWSGVHFNPLSTGGYTAAPWGQDRGVGFRLAGPAGGPAGIPEIDPAGWRHAVAFVVAGLAWWKRRLPRRC